MSRRARFVLHALACLLPAVASAADPLAPMKFNEVREIAPQPEMPAPTVVHDPRGTFVLAPASPGQAARKGQDAVAASNAQKIKVSWSAFEATFGAEQLEAEQNQRSGDARRHAQRGISRHRRSTKKYSVDAEIEAEQVLGHGCRAEQHERKADQPGNRPQAPSEHRSGRGG